MLLLGVRTGFWLNTCNEAGAAPEFDGYFAHQLLGPSDRIAVVRTSEVALRI